MTNKKWRWICLATIATVFSFSIFCFLSCSAGGSGGGAGPILVNINPLLVILMKGTSIQFTATVAGGAANSSVTWSVDGGAPNGTIDSNGNYTTPALIPTPDGQVTIRARSVVDPTAQGTATVQVATAGALTYWSETRLSDYAPGAFTAQTHSAGQRNIALTGANAYVLWNDDRNGNNDVYFTRTTDYGNSFAPNTRIHPSANDTIDSLNPSIAVDSVGRLYTTWTDANAPNDDSIFFSRSLNSGTTFLPALNLNGEADVTNRRFPGVSAMGDGYAYVLWNHVLAGVDMYMYAVRTENGGASFTPPIEAWFPPTKGVYRVTPDPIASVTMFRTVNGTNVRDIFYTFPRIYDSVTILSLHNSISFSTTVFWPQEQWGVGSGANGRASPSMTLDANNTLYVVWRDERNGAGNGDIYFARTANDASTFPTIGVLFSPNVKVNDDLDGADQRDPSIALDAQGNIYIVWTDLRNGNPDIYFAKSTNGGLSFGANVRVNQDGGATTQEMPSIAVDSVGRAYIVWTDFRAGGVGSDVYFARGE